VDTRSAIFGGMSVSLRPFAEGDANAVRSVLDATYGHDPRLRAIYDDAHGSPPDGLFGRTLLAERDGEVVAAGTILHGPRHPRRTWLTLSVAPAYRRLGIGTALLNALREIAERPLRTRGIFANEAAMGFLRRHEFGLLNRSFEGRFDPASVVARLPEPQLDRPPSLDEAATFFDGVYQAAHQFDPAEPRSLEQARQVFCGEDVIENSLVCVRAEGSMTAAANLIRPPGHDPGDELYLVWVGALGRDNDAAATVVAACVRFALEAGKAIRFEVDETNAPVCRALDRLGVLGKPEFGIFAEDAPA
jgi:GNAT superfamily N-acetyltransferase